MLNKVSFSLVVLLCAVCLAAIPAIAENGLKPGCASSLDGGDSSLLVYQVTGTAPPAWLVGSQPWTVPPCDLYNNQWCQYLWVNECCVPIDRSSPGCFTIC